MKVRVYNDEPARALTNDEIGFALDTLDPSCPRDEWIKIGMAVKDAGEDLFEEWNDWSARGEGYNEKDALAAWESFKPGKITLGSLLYRARQNGWIDPRRVAIDRGDLVAVFLLVRGELVSILIALLLRVFVKWRGRLRILSLCSPWRASLYSARINPSVLSSAIKK